MVGGSPRHGKGRMRHGLQNAFPALAVVVRQGIRGRLLHAAPRLRAALLAGCVLITPLSLQAAPTPEQKCQAGKNLVAGKYAACRAKAERDGILRPDPGRREASVARCRDVLAGKWLGLEERAQRAGVFCPSTGDMPLIADFLESCAQSLAKELSGDTSIPNPIHCPDDLAETNTALTFCSSVLLAAGDTLTQCVDELGDCIIDLAICGDSPRLPETGQASCHDAAGGLVACTGTSHDGELRSGVPRSFTDNGDGTITDNVNGLVWEKLSDDGSIHDKDAAYTWADAFAVKVAALNLMAFAGHADWRLPNLFELSSLLDLETENPRTYPEFRSNCVDGCTAETCSCTRNGHYWTSSSFYGDTSEAWIVPFHSSVVSRAEKFAPSIQVRAVRGGS